LKRVSGFFAEAVKRGWASTNPATSKVITHVVSHFQRAKSSIEKESKPH
jgi:hypothetical protein